MHLFDILSDQQKAMLALVDVHTFCDHSTDIDFGRHEIIRFFAECPYGGNFEKSLDFIFKNANLEVGFVVERTLTVGLRTFSAIAWREVKKNHTILEIRSWITDFLNIIENLGYSHIREIPV